MKHAVTPANSPTGQGSTAEITGLPSTRKSQEVEWIARVPQAVTALAAMSADARYSVDIVRSPNSTKEAIPTMICCLCGEQFHPAQITCGLPLRSRKRSPVTYPARRPRARSEGDVSRGRKRRREIVPKIERRCLGPPLDRGAPITWVDAPNTRA